MADLSSDLAIELLAKLADKGSSSQLIDSYIDKLGDA